MYYIEFQYQKIGDKYYVPPIIGAFEGRIILNDAENQRHYFKIDDYLSWWELELAEETEGIIVHDEEDMQFIGLEVTVANVSTSIVDNLQNRISSKGIDLTSRNWPGTDKSYRQYLIEETDDLYSGYLFDITDWE